MLSINRITQKLRHTIHDKRVTESTRIIFRHLHDVGSNNMMQKNQEHINSLFNQTVMGIAYLDKHGHITAANQVFQALIKYTLDDLRHIPLSHIIHPADANKEKALRNELLEGKIKDYSLEQRYIRKDGEPIWLSTHTSYFQEAKAPSIEMVIFAHDIAARKQFEEDLIETNFIKNKFFSIIGHDLRNPIDSIKILASFMEHALEKNNLDSVKEIISLLSDQAEHTQKLLNNLLKWSQAQTNQISFDPHQLNISQIILEGIRETTPIARNKKITLKHNIEKEIWIEVDPEMLKIILRNLITNAIKFSYAESTVWIKVHERSDDVLIIVEDHGKGIHPTIFEKLFHPDSKISTSGTQNERGTGLGLLLCKEFVEYHGGKIWAETSLNNGSKFLFTLPKHQ